MEMILLTGVGLLILIGLNYHLKLDGVTACPPRLPTGGQEWSVGAASPMFLPAPQGRRASGQVRCPLVSGEVNSPLPKTVGDI